MDRQSSDQSLSLRDSSLELFWSTGCFLETNEYSLYWSLLWFVNRDIMMIYNDPPPGMFIVPDKDDMTTVCIFHSSFLFLIFAVSE